MLLQLCNPFLCSISKKKINFLSKNKQFFQLFSHKKLQINSMNFESDWSKLKELFSKNPVKLQLISVSLSPNSNLLQKEAEPESLTPEVINPPKTESETMEPLNTFDLEGPIPASRRNRFLETCDDDALVPPEQTAFWSQEDLLED